MNFMETLILMGAPSAFTGLCFWFLQQSIKKRDEERREVDKAREKSQILLIKSVGASIALGEATACAVRDGHCNGELSSALEYARKVKHEQKDFMVEQGIAHLF